MTERDGDMCGRKGYKTSEYVLQSQDLKDYSRPKKGRFLKKFWKRKLGREVRATFQYSVYLVGKLWLFIRKLDNSEQE